ncbi:MAG: ATP-binding cassette domain-containing protein [Gallionella sp.]|nr:ATP-binding cassette domain-containing protein [Gallionella sp.]
METDTHAALTLNGLGVAFGSRVVLDDITLTLLPDGIDVLMGPVKAGKSTLFRTLSGLYEGHSLHKSWGSVTVSGQPVAQENRPVLVPQHTKIFDQSLLEALLQPVRETKQRAGSAEWRIKASAWLEEYGLAEHIALLDQPLLQCSTRVQRSVLILAQVLLKPSLLLIDEPTYGLPEADATWLIDWLKKISPQCKMWIALHNQMQARRIADHIVLIGGGHLLAHQDTAAFFQRPANALVEQFVRTGSLSLPSPDAREQDIEAGGVLPPPLSRAAQEATGAYPVFGTQHPAAPSDTAAAEAKKPVTLPPEIQKTPVTEPLASSAAAEVAAAPETTATEQLAAPKTAATPEEITEQAHDATEPEETATMADSVSAAPEEAAKPEVQTTEELIVAAAAHPAEPEAHAPVQETAATAAARQPVQLPPPSRNGVQLASTVGSVMLRDSSAPRGFNWIVRGKLAGCPAPGVSAPIDYDLDLLSRVGITRLITLTEDDLDQEALKRHNLTNTHLPIFDREAPSIRQTHMLLVRMQKYIEAGDVLAVHCKAGLGRTGTILASWLIRDGGLSADNAITRLRRIEPGFIQSKVQEEFLQLYEADLTQRMI